MNAESITELVQVYFIGAAAISILVSFGLERRLKARPPSTRPYRWGFYTGSMAVACAPLALVSALGMVVAGINGRWEAFGYCIACTAWLAGYTVCGWFIIRRKRWAWVIGTVLSFNPLLWFINGAYAKNRWAEFGGQAYGSAGTEGEGYELLRDATKLEAAGRARKALALYQRIAERYSHTAAGADAQKSAESLRVRLGVESAAPGGPGERTGPASASPDSTRPNLEPELAAALATKGADLLESGVRDFEPWGAKLLASVGETVASKVRLHLWQIFNASEEELRIRQSGPKPPEHFGAAAGSCVSADTAEAGLRAGADQCVARRRLTRGLSVRFACFGAVVGVFVLAVLFWRDWAPSDKVARARSSTLSGRGAGRGLTDAEVGLAQDTSAGDESGPGASDRLDDLRARAEKGDAKAQYNLGWRFYHGQGVQTNYAEAIKWFRKAAEQGCALAQLAIGLSYCSGQGVSIDYVEAAGWLRKAVDQGEGLAEYKDFAKENLVYCYAKLGECYHAGQGVPRDYVEAARWWRMAAEQGHITAQFNLGVCYHDGQGVAQDYAEAAKWFLEPAEQGDIDAQFDLGECCRERFHQGLGVGGGLAEAAKWYRRAAEQGQARAQLNLGAYYHTGVGVPQNDLEAYKWYSLAAAQGLESAAKARDWIAEGMSRTEVLEGQRRAVAFVPRKESSEGPAGPDSPLRPRFAGTEPRASGTGFFVSQDGYLLSNHHVIKGAVRVNVKTSNGLLSAKVVKTDPVNDIALLKVSGSFRPLPLANTGDGKQGQSVFTVGFPNIDLQGIEPKLTKGEISSLSGAQDDPREFQISVPVQPGNSGGPLVDASGNVIGIVTARLSDAAAVEAGGAVPQNVNYATKISYAVPLLESVPGLADKLNAPHPARDRKFEDTVQEARAGTALVLAY